MQARVTEATHLTARKSQTSNEGTECQVEPLNMLPTWEFSPLMLYLLSFPPSAKMVPPVEDQAFHEPKEDSL